MTRNTFRRILQRMIPGIVMTIVLGTLVVALFHSLTPVLNAFGPDFGLRPSDLQYYTALTDQFRRAELELPLILTGALCIALSLLSCRIAHGPASLESRPAHHGLRITVAVLLWVILFLPLFALTLYFTEVNTVRFGTALGFILDAVQAGLF